MARNVSNASAQVHTTLSLYFYLFQFSSSGLDFNAIVSHRTNPVTETAVAALMARSRRLSRSSRCTSAINGYIIRRIWSTLIVF